MALRRIFSASLALVAALGLAAGFAACEGCQASSAVDRNPSALAAGPPPTVRLYLTSSVAGALEPCGCSKNQLGGFDHFAALLAAERSRGRTSALVLAAGPLFFLDPSPRGDQATQDGWKAEAIADALAKVGFVGWAPGANDWCGGAPTLARLTGSSQGRLLAANLTTEGVATVPTMMRDVGGTRVGIVGVSTPTRLGLAPEGVRVALPAEKLRAAVEELRAQGAQILVGLAALPRGEALRLAETLPELHVLLIGKPFDAGEANDKPSSPLLLGSTLVVETANHLQTVGVVDFHVRSGSFSFQDAAGINRTAERDALTRRRDELASKLRQWEQDPTIKAADLDARRRDFTKVERDIAALETPPPPRQGSFFRFTSLPVTSELGSDKDVRQTMLTFYEKVNDHNRQAFAGRTAPPPGPDGNRYIGVEACASCHPGAKAVWDQTAHAHAYKTLSDQHKEFNLDCVSCHVTGYEKPGGSTVTANASLQNVQCENCHGPGGNHRAKPAEKGLVLAHPSAESCVSGCHHPPHVEGFDAVAQMPRILGPGHGREAK